LYRILGASTSATVVVGVGETVAQQGVSRHPILSDALGIVTLIFTLMQIEFFSAQWLFHSKVLGLTTVWKAIL
jgi:hypothetical protein